MKKKLLIGIVSFIVIITLVISFGLSTFLLSPSVKASTKITNKPITLSVWMAPNPDMLVTAKSLNETPFAKELEKRTGVKVNFIHPPVGQENEQFNLVVASGDLPDIMIWDWRNGYPGGVTKAIGDGVIISLNDLFKKGYAPNFTKILKENSLYDKLAKTDDGKYYVFPLIRQNGDPILTVYFGLVLRKDWLDDLKLQVPTTIDEWYKVLKAFKEKKGAKTPLTFLDNMLRAGNFFVGAYGVGIDFYLDKGKVKYGPAESGYKQFLATFNKWYKEKLLDPEWSSQDRKTIDAKILSGSAGAFIGTPDSWVGVYLSLMKQKDPKFDLVGAPNPTLKKGDVPKFRFEDWPVTVATNAGAAITGKCKQKEVACKWLDYWYSKEGQLLTNYGIQNVSYKIVNGKPRFTDFIKKNPNGWTFKQAMARYVVSALGYGLGVQWKEPVMEQKFFPQQIEVVKVWSIGSSAWRIPPVTYTPEESKKLASIVTNLSTYRDEMYLKFIMGNTSLNNFDKYVNNLKRMGLNEAIKIIQTAVNRFNKR